jgi:hypothetical protein
MSVIAAGMDELQTYSLCDVGVRVECQESHQATGIRTLWPRVFALQTLNASRPASTVHLRFTPTGNPLQNAAVGEAVFLSRGLNVFSTRQGFHLQCGSSVLDVDVSSGRGAGVLDERFWSQPLQDQREFFLLSLIMLVRSYGRYALHANGVAKEDTGFLIVGNSGCGKTTLTISLLREGWCYLSDDAVMLGRTARGIEAQAFRRGFSCAPDLAAHLPAGSAAVEGSPCLSDGKRLVDPDSLFPGRFRPRCSPQVILFPRLSGRRLSQLVPLDQTGALLGLIQQSAGLMTGRTSVAHQQLELLKDLVQQASSYQLLLGSDAYQDPASVARLLWEARRG